MKSEDVANIINEICDKLGIAMNYAKDFVPKLAKHEITAGAYAVVVSIICISLSVYFIRLSIKKAKAELNSDKQTGRWNRDSLTEYPSVWASSICGGIVVVIFTFDFIVAMQTVIAWLSSPEIAAIEYVLSFVK